MQINLGSGHTQSMQPANQIDMLPRNLYCLSLYFTLQQIKLKLLPVIDARLTMKRRRIFMPCSEGIALLGLGLATVIQFNKEVPFYFILTAGRGLREPVWETECREGACARRTLLAESY